MVLGDLSQNKPNERGVRRMPSVALRKKPAGKDTEPPPCVIYPKGGKGNARSKPGKEWSHDQRLQGSGVGYAKGRY